MSLVGGIVNEIQKSNIFLQKPLEDLPKSVFLALKNFDFKDKSLINKTTFQLYGSSRLKIQPYYGDLDSICIYQYKNVDFIDLCNNVAKNIQKIVLNNIKKGYFITDIKCGLYEVGNFKGNSIHWTAGEILQGFRNEKIPDINGNLGQYITLFDAIAQKQINKNEGDEQMIKIDLIIPFNNKYFEATCMYFIYTENYKTFLFPSNFLEYGRILTSLINDVEKQKKKDRPFKIMKRLYALLRIIVLMFNLNSAYNYARFIVPIIGSNISRVSSVYSDLSTLGAIYETKQANIDEKFASNSVQNMKDRLNVIIDLKTIVENQSLLNSMLDDLTKQIFFIRKKEKFNIIIDNINKIKSILNNCIIKELETYFNSVNTTTKKFINETLNYCISTRKKYLKTNESVDLRKLNKKYFI